MSNPLMDLPELNSNPLMNLPQLGKSVTSQLPSSIVEPEDSLGMQFLKSVGHGFVQTPASILNTTSRLITPLSSVANRLQQFSDSLKPNTGEEETTGEKVVGTLGEIAGSLIPTGLAFKGVSLGTKAAGSVIGRLFPSTAKTALDAIAKAGYNANQFFGANKAGSLANAAVTALPENLVSGLALQGLIDPESLTEPKGLAMGVGMSALGALADAKFNPKYSTPKQNIIDPSLPIYTQQLRKARSNSNVPEVESLDNLLTTLESAFVDYKAPLKRVDAAFKANGADKSVYAASQLANGSASKAEQWIYNKPLAIDPNTKETVVNEAGKSLRDILSPLQTTEETELLRDYLLAKRVTDARIQNTNVNVAGVTLPDAVQQITNTPANIKQIGDEITGFLDNLLDFEINTGRLSQEVADQWRASSPNYIPLQRVFDDFIDPGLKPKDNTFGTRKVSEKLKGSDRAIQDPILSTKDRVYTTVRAADRNAIGQRMLDLALSNPMEAEGLGIRLIKQSDKYDSPQFYETVDKFKKKMLDNGVVLDNKVAQEMIAYFGKSFDPQSNVLSVWKDGSLHKMQLPTELAQVYKSMSPEDFSMMTNLLSLPAKTLRTGITAALDFSGVNAIRDTFQATLNSKYGFRPGIDSWRGFVESLKKGPKYQEFLAGGGGMGNIGRYGEIDPTHSVFRSLLPQTKTQVTKNVFRHPIQALKELARPFEEAARVGEFIRGREQGASITEAALAARKVTTDFSQIGGQMRALSQMTAFLNPAVQSLATDIRNVSSDPAKVAMKGFASIALPSIALWFANRDDQEINDLRKTELGNTQWFLRLPNGEIGRIPKPFIYGQVFGSTMEAALDSMLEKDPEAISRLAKGYYDQAAFNMIPNAISVPMQLYANKDAFSGAPIVPTGMQDLAREAQVQPFTTSLAQRISNFVSSGTGEAVNISPIQVDYIIRNTTGSLGSGVSKSLDSLLKKEGISPPEKELADYPFFSRFLARYPSSNVAPVRSFYDKAAKVNEAVKTAAYYEKTFNPKLESYIESHINELSLASIYAEAQKQMADIRSSLSQINSMEDDVFSPTEKREYSEYLGRQLIEIARGVNDAVAESQSLAIR